MLCSSASRYETIQFLTQIRSTLSTAPGKAPRRRQAGCSRTLNAMVVVVLHRLLSPPPPSMPACRWASMVSRLIITSYLSQLFADPLIRMQNHSQLSSTLRQIDFSEPNVARIVIMLTGKMGFGDRQQVLTSTPLIDLQSAPAAYRWCIQHTLIQSRDT